MPIQPSFSKCLEKMISITINRWWNYTVKIFRTGEICCQIIQFLTKKLQSNSWFGFFFGGLPTCDLPFLWKLKDEIEEAVNEILAMDKYHKLQQVFAERPNPKFSRFSYVMASKENEMISNILIKIQDKTSADPICLLFDGLVLEAKTSD